ncbi:serine threonine protein kinase [Ophiostoma piceae UAMH 11346]|uniref:Serine threonine protein kinase n=1 Tax=Ophiostoma piceae (strain UAMH 11346) TaxID=1262450 RepID=S3D4S6_OPHP1|nr:serine threonine protein kinase [Ophiostoma piceae UAMH 11346]
MDQQHEHRPETPNHKRKLTRFAAVIKTLSREGLNKLGHQLLKKEQKEHYIKNSHTVAIGQPMCGSYHILYPIQVDGKPEWLIRIPSNGVKGKWDQQSADALVSEAKTMNYLHNTCVNGGPPKLPIPRVIAFSDTTNNSISCPYIALAFIDGVPLYKVWFQDRLQPGRVDAATVQKHRMRTLDGLVEAMAELGKHTFDQGGSLVFEDSISEKGHTFLNRQSEAKLLKVGPARLPDVEAMLARAVEEDNKSGEAVSPTEQADANDQSCTQTHNSVLWAAFAFVKKAMKILNPLSKYTTRRVNSSSATAANRTGSGSRSPDDDSTDTLLYYTWGPSSTPSAYITAPLDRRSPDHPFQKGVDALIRKLIFWIPDPFTAREHGQFVLRHPDLNMQNIIVSDDGTVVGIIDWDGVAAVPRCLGSECYPMFLTRDWNPCIYEYDPRVDDSNNNIVDPESPEIWEDSPEALSKLRGEYLMRAAQLRENQAPFSENLTAITRQSVVTENIAIAAFDPLCRSHTLRKIVSESWKALQRSTGEDYTHIILYDVIQMFVTGDPDPSVMSALEKAFLKLLETVDT